MSSGVYVKSIQALVDFRNGVGEFCHDTQHALDGVARDIRRFQEWLLERQHYWQRRVEEDDEDREAYEELQNVIRWRWMVEQVVEEQYKPQAYRLARWVNTELPKAQVFLGETVNKLEQFINVATPSSSGMSSASTSIATSISGSASTASSQPTSSGSAWVEKGIRNTPIKNILKQIDFNQSHVKETKDFGKVAHVTMLEGFRKLREVVLSAVEQGADGDYFAKLDQEQGLPYEHGYERVYDAFYGDDAIRVNKMGEKYDVINGYHRLFVAKELGLETLPIQIVERVEEEHNTPS
ncbi:hypothetical protein U27_00399 [Candidatus Vecturithrix granuli]|uniref:ParB/Sulfiredoxin domain-containing protein n=1 Tax=Vecturithrix granuli TaxID=1499967 RepID=A0A081C7E7_VECG1|nr:hypothetical protein U27_00399 [Candidatus Vecturithrix granuli]